MRIHIITAVEIGRVWGRGWRRAACKLYVEGSERGFVCSLIPGGHLQYSIGERLALYYFSVSLTGFFFFSFFQGTLKKVRLKTSYLIWVGTPSHSNLISNFYLFLMENILLLLFTVANTHFQMSADCFFFFFLTCRYHLLKLDLAFT